MNRNIRVENKFENQFLLLNYIFVSRNNKMEFLILLKNRKTPNYRIKVKFLKNAILRQRRGFVPSKINIMGLTSFEAPIAVKVVHPQEHPKVAEGSEWALRLHRPNNTLDLLISRTLNKLNKSINFEYMMQLTPFKKNPDLIKTTS